MKTLKVSPIEFVKVSDLRFNTKARIETDFQSVLEKVKENGMSKPLLVERITNKVLSGNLLLPIALELGITHVPVVYTDLKSQQNQVLRSVA
jgi:ParB-like chromosome segregation protein Spo0J